MKVLLVHPWGGYVHEYPSLGLLYIASVLRQEGHKVAFFDQGAPQINSQESFEGFVQKFNPEICGFSLYTTNLLQAYELIKQVKRLSPGSKIVVGGPHATALPERTMFECQDTDFLVYGEGEHTLVDLLNSISEGGSFQKVRGIYYRKNGKEISTEPREYIPDLDVIPFPAYDLIQDYRYSHDPIRIGKKIATIVTSRGCPYNCTFCNKAVFGSTYRRRSPQNVVAEIKHQIEQYQVDEIYFMDDLFAINRRWLEEFYHELKKNDVFLPWKCLGRVDVLTQEDFIKMKKNGCYVIQFGVESGNGGILKDIRKRITTNQVIKAFRSAKKAGLNTYGFFIFGHRKDTYATIKQTLKFAQRLNPDFVSFFVLAPFPGAQVYSYLGEEDKYNWERIRYISWAPGTLPISICNVKSSDLALFESQAYFEYFGRTRYLIKNVLLSSSSFALRKIKFQIWRGNLAALLKATFRRERIFKKFER